MTIPAIEAIRLGLRKQMLGEGENGEPEEEHTVDQALRFVAQFQKR